MKCRGRLFVLYAVVAVLGWPSNQAISASAIESNVPPIGAGGAVHRNIDTAIRGHDAASSRRAVTDFLATRGRSAATLNTLVMQREMAARQSGRRVVEFGQKVNGLTVYGARAKAVFAPDGTLEMVSDRLAPVAGRPAPAGVTAEAALSAALNRLHPGVSTVLVEKGRSGNSVTFMAGTFFFRDPKVTRVAIPGPGNSLAEGFVVETWSAQANQLHYTLVDGQGEVIYVENRTASAPGTFNVFDISPDVSSQEIVDGHPSLGAGCGFAPESTWPSPCGWVLSGTTQYSTYIKGFNTNAYLDDDANNSPPSSGLTLIDDYQFITAFDPNVAPTTAGNSEVAVQNLFYLTNKIHDELYVHGFTETEGNFQDRDFGRSAGGAQAAADPLLAEAQDGSGTNNANMATPADGSSPRMQMYVTTLSTPNRDTSLDADVVWHEFGHGLTWRVVQNMTGHFGGSIGEGSADSLAIIMHDSPVVGEWSFNDPLGIRSASYEGYLETTGRSYNNWTTGSVHTDGEIYGAIMWDMWKKYRDDASGDIGASQEARRDQLMTDIVQGMIMTSYPGFPSPAPPSMRDGMLYAIGGNPDPMVAPADAATKLRWCNVWDAFAKFGVGTDQLTTFTWIVPPIIGQWEWEEGFATPVACQANTAPVANDDSVTTDEDTSVAVTLSATDQEQSSLTYIIVGGPSNGTLTGTGANRTYTPDGDFNGADSFTFKANDGALDSNVATVSITVNSVNDPPVANDDAATVDAGSGININVKGNDSDPDHTTAQLTVLIASTPSHGTVVIEPDGTVTYTHTGTTETADSFTYTLQDPDNATAATAATVSITINQTPPPPPPGGLPATPTLDSVTDNANGTAEIAWTDNSGNVDGREIQREKLHKNGKWTGSETIDVPGATVTSYTDSTGEGTFHWRIRAYNSSGFSAWTDWYQSDVTGGGNGGGGNGGGGNGGGKPCNPKKEVCPEA